MYLNLLFRALKVDINTKRVKAFVKRIVQIATFHQPPFICGVLYLLSELEAAVPSIRTMMNTPEELDEDEEEVFKDVPEEGEDEKEQKKEKILTQVEYDGRKRDPLYANADRTCLWELVR
jgi:ribosome biogenesis protein MAK21